MNPPRVVTSEQCLSCRGCCLFHEAQSAWSPRLTADDAVTLGVNNITLVTCTANSRSEFGACHQHTANSRSEFGTCPQFRCSFLDEKNHHCSMYEKRPFECQFYPFLLSAEKDGFRVYAHLSCPAVEAFKAQGTWITHVAVIKEFFGREDVLSFVRQNASGFPDYSASHDELEEIFLFDPAEALWQERIRIEAALSQRSRALSSLAFVNMFAWQDFFRFEVVDMGGALCVFARQPVGVFMYWPPLGKDIHPSAVDACFARMAEVNRGGSLTRVENVAQDELKHFDMTKYEAVLRGHEYVYERARVAALSGNDLKSRRHEVNVFEREYAGRFVFRPYVPADFNACAKLFEGWLDARFKKHDNDVYRHMLLENRGVHRLVLSYAARLGLIGRVVEIDGRIAAYTFGYALNKGTFCVLFEVADLMIKGLPAFVFSRSCADEALKGYQWINAMDDFEAQALADTKRSWHPARMEPVYTVRSKEN